MAFYTSKIIVIGILIGIGLHPVFAHAGDQPAVNSFVHHDLHVVLHPKEHRFTAEDTVTIPENFPREFSFSIHRGLNPVARSEGVLLSRDIRKLPYKEVESFRIRLPNGLRKFVIRYGGVINHPLEQVGKEQARGYSQTIGKIAGEGIYLSGRSHWYPVFDSAFLTFSLTAELTDNWDAISQGERTLHQKNEQKTRVRWLSPEPQEEIFLVAGKFHEYTKTAGAVQAMVFLRSPDPVLAEKYLDATARYIPLYETLIGPYPYKKFALVENFWETGFGMPSFTLLGPKVIRLPFIIHTSYPHEILHNWWGNSVFPDYEEGNWAEGLTAYLSDHLNAEQKGEDGDYRQTTLQKYADYVSGGKEFPLTAFRSRHSSSSEAIGYGKALMFFHMLRLELRDEIFIKGLRDFYKGNKFRYASFQDLRKSFERVSGKDLGYVFRQWIKQTGAPELKIRDAAVRYENGRYVVTAIIDQVQKGQPYRVLLPVAVTMEGQKQAYQTLLLIEKTSAEVRLDLPARPLRIDVDPEFDIFRRLDRKEMPPAITQVLGAGKLLIILPSSAEPSLLRAYRTFAEALGKAGPDQIEIRLDRELTAFPSQSAVCVLGAENLFFDDVVKMLSQPGFEMDRRRVHIKNTSTPLDGHSIVLTGRNPNNQDAGVLFISSDSPEALKGLSRKLPHYHKYSYLIFRGDEPENIAKGRWPVSDSPLTSFLIGDNGSLVKVPMGTLEKRKPLAPLSDDFSADRMMTTIRFLSGREMKGRAWGSAELDRAAAYIADQFKKAGLRPAGDGGESYFQKWEEVDSSGHRRDLINVIGVIPGRDESSQSIVIGAHYDHLGIAVSPEGGELIYHGADDNASGVAVVIELAHLLGKSLNPDRKVVFIAFTGEEIGRKGSQYYVAHLKRDRNAEVMGMLNIDTVGRLWKKRLLILGSGSAREWELILKGAGHMTGVEIQLIAEELDSSDQKSFQEAGIPAVQFFTGPHSDYHKPTDTEEKIDAEGLVKVASVAKKVVEHLAMRQNSLTATIAHEQKTAHEPKIERKVSFGIIPDFAHGGEGCRISGVVEGSPADKTGLREGDVITGINGERVNNLKDFSDVLKTLKPGDKVRISFLREGIMITAEGMVSERR